MTTLSGNLINDVMALIPKNQEIITAKVDNILINIEPKYSKIEKEAMIYGYYNSLNKLESFEFVSHCLRTIPEFQIPLDRYKDLENHANNPNIRHNIKELMLMNELLLYMPETIASATLHGQVGFPPSTIGELCESYKKVINNN